MPEPCAIPMPHMHERLVRVSSSLGRHYAAAASTLQARLTADDLARWADCCERLAQSGWRAWESAEAFCRLSPFLLQHLGPAALWQWAEMGHVLARQSSEAATAFFRAARLIIPRSTPDDIAAWLAGGQWYLQQYRSQPSLAVSYFQVSALLHERHAWSACTLWQQLGQELAPSGVTNVRRFFELSRLGLEQEGLIDPIASWELARRLVPQCAELALQWLERYADLERRLGPDLTRHAHDIVMGLLTSDAAPASTFLRLLSGTLGLLPVAERRQGLRWCQEIAAVDPLCMLEFLQHLPDLSRRLRGERCQAWVSSGLDIAAQNAAAGLAYFGLESATARDGLQRLQGQVTFAESQRVLQLYSEGFTRRRIELCTTDAMPVGLQRGEHGLPTSDGNTVFVPPQVDTFAQARDNFAVYKVAILHQLGFYAYGTFTFTVSEWLRRMPQMQGLLPFASDLAGGASQTPFARFFAAFDQPELARQLFAMLEDARIDAHLGRHYKGLRPDLERLMRHSLAQRPAMLALSLRQALLEGLLQLTLGGDLMAQVPPGLQVLLAQLAHQVDVVQAPAASVYETASAVVACYHLITQIPLWATTAWSAGAVERLEAMADTLPDDADMMSLADLFRQAGEGAEAMPALPDSDEAASGTAPVPYRGEMKPDLIEKKLQLQERLDMLEGLQEALSPIPPERLKELLEQGDVQITSLEAGELAETSGLFMTDLEGREAQLREMLKRLADLQRQVDDLDTALLEAFGDLEPPEQAFFYDEWDYLIQDYRPAWCRLTEMILPEDDTAFVQDTRQKYADLLNQVRRQFQLLKPEMFRKIKRLIDGEEIDLDSAIEALVDRRAGNALSEKVYMRRVKRDREVAAVFLLDMSASTDDNVPESPHTAAAGEAAPPLPRRFDFSGFISEEEALLRPGLQPVPSRRRIIDVEKEALILMAEALETLGDAYAVYGFSGYGRDQVDFFVAKEFTDPYDERTQGRIAAMKPHRSTRMGPAIRHAVRKLERQQARIRTLLMLSDGYPQDYDYGKDRKSKDYGIQDTMMALREAQLKGIQTFCITVDPCGHDYLREMCPDQQYLVIDDIAALPDELPKVYRGLTT